MHGFSTNRLAIDDSFYGTQIRMSASLRFDVYNHTIIDDEIFFVVDKLFPNFTN